MWINHVPISGHIGLVLSFEPCKRSLQFGRSTLWFLFFPCYLIAQMMGQTAPYPNWHWNRGTCFCLGLGTDTSSGPFQSHLFHGFMMTPLNLKYWILKYYTTRQQVRADGKLWPDCWTQLWNDGKRDAGVHASFIQCWEILPLCTEDTIQISLCSKATLNNPMPFPLSIPMS